MRNADPGDAFTDAPRDLRAMVTLRRISAVAAIPDADRIEAATVDGWTAVVARGAFAPGRAVLYCEIDSFLPCDPRFGQRPDLAIEWRGRRGNRLVTMVMRRQISQGLVLDPGLFPEALAAIAGRTPEAMAGEDLSEVLGVLKWEADVPGEIAASAIGRLPSRIGSTSLPRLQNLPDLFRDHAGHRFSVSTKIDGMSMHGFLLDGPKARIGCGAWELRERPGDPVWSAARSSGLCDALEAIGLPGLQVQAEVYGRATRAGYHEGREGSHLAIFHARDNAAGRDLGRDGFRELVERMRIHAPGLETAPDHGTIAIDDYAGRPEALFDLAEGPSIDPKRRREGVVLRRVDGAFAFKVISNRQLARRA